jgi:flagellar FliL protein
MADHAKAPPAEGAAPKKKSKKLLLAIPVLLIAAGAGGWFSGIIPKMLGTGGKPAHTDSAHTGTPDATAKAEPPVYVDIPEIVSNLNVPGKRASYMKMHAKLEIASHTDEAAVTAAMPRIQDLFQTYLRDMRPDELRGSEGSYRLREELISRASLAATPARVLDVLFVALIIE